MRLAVAAALIGMAAMGAAGQANATPADQPNCVAAPESVGCDGSGLGLPTGPADPACIASPGDGVCAGGPFASPATPPAIGSDMPGSIMPDGMPEGSGPPPSMPGSITGMPGTI